MTDIRIMKIRLENFKVFKEREIYFGGNNAVLAGENATGKTTIADAVNWVLFNKLSSGSAPDGIRPHDKDGKDIDYVEICVELDLSVDGSPMTIKKTQKQNWVTPRGKAEARFDGNVNLFEVNSVPMSESEYKKKIAGIVSEEVFRFASNGSAFLDRDTKKRRTKLLDLAGDFSYTDVLEKRPDLLLLEDILARYTYEEAVALTNKELKERKAKLDDIPVRIDELSKSKAEGDSSALRIQADTIRGNIAAIAENDLAAEIAELQQQKNRLLTDAENSNRVIKLDAGKKVDAAEDAHTAVSNELRRALSNLDNEKRIKEATKKELVDIREKYKAEQAAEFTGIDTCPTCGQALPESTVAIAKERFEKNKATKLADLTSLGNGLHAKVTEKVNSIADIETKIASLEAKEADAKDLLENARKASANVALAAVDTSEIDTQIADKQKQLAESGAEQRKELTEQLVEAERQIAKIDANKAIDDRIAELDASRKDISQEIANAEQTKFMLEEYNRAKVTLLTDEVNEHFGVVKWVLFREQINGGIQEVCDATVDGSVVGRGLNHGHSILAGLDICLTMQKVEGVSVPVFLDDAESVDDWRIPKTDCQLIVLRRTDGEMEVKTI